MLSFRLSRGLPSVLNRNITVQVRLGQVVNGVMLVIMAYSSHSGKVMIFR